MTSTHNQTTTMIGYKTEEICVCQIQKLIEMTTGTSKTEEKRCSIPYSIMENYIWMYIKRLIDLKINPKVMHDER